MANKTVYGVKTSEEMVVVATVKEVAKLLGTKVTKKGIEAGEYPEVTLLQPNEEPTEEVVEPTVEEEPTPEPEVTEQDTKAEQHKQAVLEAIEKAMEALDDTKHPALFDQLCELEDAINDGMELTEEQAQVAVQVLQGTYVPTEEEDTPALTNTDDTDTDEDSDTPSLDSDKEYPEVGSFDTEKAMKKYIKGLTDAELQEWCELEGATWKPNEHQSINRMRMAMAIKALHFPDTAPKKSKKSKSKYADYTTEQLVAMALDNDVEVKDDKGNERILRMYTIMALRNAGIIE